MSWDQRSPSPFTDPTGFDPYARRPSASRVWMWIVLGGGLFVALLCCGGVGLVVVGVNMLEVEVKNELRDNPKLREHIGEIESLDTDFVESMALEDDETYRYRVRGTKGAGELTVKQHTDADGNEVIDEARLRLSDGTQVQIVP